MVWRASRENPLDDEGSSVPLPCQGEELDPLSDVEVRYREQELAKILDTSTRLWRLIQPRPPVVSMVHLSEGNHEGRTEGRIPECSRIDILICGSLPFWIDNAPPQAQNHFGESEGLPRAVSRRCGGRWHIEPGKNRGGCILTPEDKHQED